MTVCCCYNPRFDVDRFGRVIYPDPFNNDFHALDNNGNPVFRVHNRDLFPSVSVGAVVNIQTTDRALYLGDHINNQIIVLTWKADAERILDVSTAMAERLGRGSGSLAMANFPNPFNASTAIRITGTGAFGSARLEIFNTTGRRIADLTPAVRSGRIEVKWDATNVTGNRVPSGLYYCRLSVDGKALNKAMLLVK
jgi:hypothetical protein